MAFTATAAPHAVRICRRGLKAHCALACKVPIRPRPARCSRRIVPTSHSKEWQQVNNCLPLRRGPLRQRETSSAGKLGNGRKLPDVLSDEIRALVIAGERRKARRLFQFPTPYLPRSAPNVACPSKPAFRRARKSTSQHRGRQLNVVQLGVSLGNHDAGYACA